MGNSSNKTYHRSRRKYASEYSLSDLVGGSCSGGRAVQEDHYPPRSYSSRRSRSIGTFDDPVDSSKTVWPLSRSQAIFMPEFRVRDDPGRTDYKILELVATGAYGRVYKVRRGADDRVYALKMIGKAKIIEEDAVGQVKQEVSIQKAVGHHPFVAQVLEHWQGRKTLYITMEYLSGGELFSLIEEYGRLPEAVVRIYVGEISLALDFLHNAGIVHRDIKAANVLLDKEGHAVLIDFGLAKWLGLNQRTCTFCGTPEYMAPEILSKEFYSHAVDWWSLGVLACFALTHEYPHTEASTESRDDYEFALSSNGKASQDPRAVTLVTRTILPADSRISAEAEDLLRRLLQPEPRSRLKSIFALQRIAFYMGHDIRGYVSKQLSPLKLLGRPKTESASSNDQRRAASNEHDAFKSFDSAFR